MEMLVDIGFYLLFLTIGIFFVWNKVLSKEEKIIIISESKQTEKEKIATSSSIFLFVASSRGKYYYQIDSNRANSLSEKNRIYFKSQEEAEKAGFKPYFEH